MPGSRAEGKEWIAERVIALEPVTICDVGAGVGTYWTLLADSLPEARWTAVEIFEPYVAKFDLKDKYDSVIVGDFNDVDLQPHDVVILGDVLDHVARPQIMWDKARSLGPTFAVVPLDHVEQGPVGGNPYEEHLHYFTHEEMMSMGGVTDYWVGPHKGCYVAR